MKYYTSLHQNLQAAPCANFGCKCKLSVNESLKSALRLPLRTQLCYTMYTIPNRRQILMSTRSKRKKDHKQMLVRIVSLALAALMVLSVVMATVWQW